MIAEGKVPRESSNEKCMEETTEMKILYRMLKKYERVIEFYTEGKNPEQVDLAKKEMQECLRVAHEVQKIFNVNVKEENG